MRKVMMVLVVAVGVLGGVVLGQEGDEVDEEAIAQRIIENVRNRELFEIEMEYFQVVIAAFKSELGLEHPITLNIMTTIGIRLAETGSYKKAKEIEEIVLKTRRRKLGDDHPDTLNSMANIATILYAQGNLENALAMEETVLETRRRNLGTYHPDTLIAMTNIAMTMKMQENFQGATEVEEKILAIRRHELGIEHPKTLAAMANLALTMKLQDNSQDAHALEEAIWETRHRKLGPDHPDTLSSMSNLALTLRQQGYTNEALQLEKAVSSTARRLHAYGYKRRHSRITSAASSMMVSNSTFDWNEYTDSLRENLAYLQGSLGKNHSKTLDSAQKLAKTFYELKRFDDAQTLLTDIIEIRRHKLTPDEHLGSVEEYEALEYLAKTYQNTNMRKHASTTYIQAIKSLETLSGRLATDTDALSRYEEEWAQTYQDAIIFFLDLNQKSKAHDILERFRSHQIINTVAPYHIATQDVQPNVNAQLRHLDIRHENALTNLKENLHKASEESIYITEIRDIQRERKRLIEDTRTKAPNISSLRFPEPFGVDKIRNLLEPGTLLISFLVHAEVTYLFTLSQENGINVHKVEIDQHTIQSQSALFLEQLQQSEASGNLDSATKMASWLYANLLGGISKSIESSERLLIIPDGPLFHLPFTSLISSDGNYLIESKPIHSVSSATTFAQAHEKRRPTTNRHRLQIAAFGSPTYLGLTEIGKAIPSQVAPMMDKSATLFTNRSKLILRSEFINNFHPLPGSRREVVGIGKIYPSVQKFLEQDATEDNFMTLRKDIDIIHVAAHGMVDQVKPLLSFIALSTQNNSDRENGLIRAWEIYEKKFRLDAELIILSACQSALGHDTDGQGLIGLSLAFQAAGARTVIASLWNINDESTAELMIRFYKHLKGNENTPGKSKDEALRAAQLEFIQGPVTFTDTNGDVVTRDFSSPYYWAAFQVIGDWK